MTQVNISESFSKLFRLSSPSTLPPSLESPGPSKRRSLTLSSVSELMFPSGSCSGKGGQRDFSPRAYFLIRHPQRSQANLVPRGANNDQAKVSLVHSTSQRPVTDVDCPSILPGLGPCWKKWNYWGDKNKKSLSSDSARIPLPGE